MKPFPSLFDVPPTTTTTIDPYTGNTTVTTQPGYHVENKTTEIRMKNQPFTPYEIQDKGKSWTLNFFFNIRLKGHYTENWSYYRLHNCSSDGNLLEKYGAEYTNVPINDYLPSEGKIDVQIEALIGYEQGVVTVPGAPGTARVITGETSGWSSIQTLDIATNSITTAPAAPDQSQTPTTPPDQTQNSTTTSIDQSDSQNAESPSIDGMQIATLTLLSVVAVLLAALILVVHRRKTKQASHQDVP